MAKTKRRKKRGSSKAGRPRIEGERYTNGRLKPPGPNKTTIAKRQAGDASAGEHPLDFALSQAWITEQQHRDAMSYRATYNSTHIGGPRLSCGSLAEVPPQETMTLNWSQMSDEEIVVIFDSVFNDAGKVSADPEKAEEGAWARWRLLNAALSAAEREQLFMVSIVGSWPFWFTKQAAGKALGAQDQERKAALFSALSGVAAAARPRKKRDTITSAPTIRRRKPGTEVPVRYETQFGDQLEPTSERGRPFEVTVVRRRGA